MKKGWIIVIVVAVLLALWGVVAYNGLVSKEETVKQAWAQVEKQYQRRADLIPDLVSTVKGYAAHESETLESVVSARARATQMTPESIEQYQSAQEELSQALGRLLMLAENYPDLNANQKFLKLQKQLEEIEESISVESKHFNETVQIYNTSIRRFPTNVFAGLFGFRPNGYFEAEEGANTAPDVEF